MAKVGPAEDATPDPEQPAVEGESPAEGQSPAIANFLEKNPKLELMKKARDSKGGIFKIIDVAIFGFLLFAPALPIIPTMEEPAVVLVLWVLIGLIMWCKIEYAHRAEVWHMCLCRGVIVDFPKTNSLMGWLCQIPMFFALGFLLLFGLMTYIGLDPKFEFKETNHVVTALLAIVGVIFVLLLTKSLVDTEGAPSLQSLNLVIHLFQDEKLLEEKGFHVVHFTQLQAFVRTNGGKEKFSLNQVHALSHSPHSTERVSLIGGTRMFLFLKRYKDSDE